MMSIYVKTKKVEALFGLLGVDKAWVLLMSALTCRDKKI
jgi:hypothetical protein